MKTLIILSSVLFLTGCFDDGETQINANKHLSLGKTTFEKNCVVCHGKAAQGLVKDWKKSINNVYPAPPLNGTAHTWHHSPVSLLRTINEGGTAFGGKMPGFKDKLNEAEKQALLDYLYSLWPREIQQRYDARFK